MSRIYDALKKAEQESKRTTPSPHSVAAAPTASGATQTPVVAGEIEQTPPSLALPLQAAVSVPPAAAVESNPSATVPPTVPVAPTEVPLGSEATPRACTEVEAPASQTKGPSVPKPAKKKTPERLQIFSPDGSELLGAEEFRRLRTKLQHAREKRPLKTLLVTSALPGEGKTFVTVNLAQTFTKQHHARVLVIDADFRKPQVHAQLRVPNDTGLSDYLENRCGLEAVIHRSANANLDYIVGGPVSAHPAELAGSVRFSELLSSVNDEYEWVLIDTPPILPVTDASVIARYCDAVLLVVAAGQTPGDLAQAARKELQDANLVGVVLNRATTTTSSYKHYYYYSYSHGTEKAARAAAVR